MNLTERATYHIKDILRDSIRLQPSENTLILFDNEAPLTHIMTEAYRQALPKAHFLDVNAKTPAEIMAVFDAMKEGDLVVLVQSTNFRLEQFRLRLELFKRGLKTIEHTQLSRMTEPQFEIYIESLAYDSDYYHSLGRKLKSHLDQAQQVIVECRGTKLVYSGPMEESKLNIGDYEGMKNIGGTFPIGEVFTEPKDLTQVNGEALVFSFAGDQYLTKYFEPFKIIIQDGVLVDDEGPEEFKVIMAKVRETEKTLVREFGLGINPAMNKTKMINDVTAFERQTGLHFSLGAKHGLYPKPGLSRKKGRYHVDVFVDAEKIFLDEKLIFSQGVFQP